MPQAPTSPAFVPTVLDVEASGFGRNSYPIEIGFVMPDGHAHCTLVKPESHWTHWDAQAAAMHHISRSLIEERGLPVQAVAGQLNRELRGQTVYSDGWINDYTWLGALFDAADMTPAFKLENLRLLVEPATMGDPMRPLMWVSKSHAKLASAFWPGYRTRKWPPYMPATRPSTSGSACP